MGTFEAYAVDCMDFVGVLVQICHAVEIQIALTVRKITLQLFAYYLLVGDHMSVDWEHAISAL